LLKSREFKFAAETFFECMGKIRDKDEYVQALTTFAVFRQSKPCLAR